MLMPIQFIVGISEGHLSGQRAGVDLRDNLFPPYRQGDMIAGSFLIGIGDRSKETRSL